MAQVKLFQRIGYSFKMGWRKRKALKDYLHNPTKQIKSVTELTPERLQQEGAQVLVLDFDGVLGPDNELIPNDNIKLWLDQVYSIFHDKLFILSNKPLSTREDYLKIHYPKLQFIKGVAKKPYPEGLQLIQTKTGTPGANIIFCDDRLLTGVLAAELASVKVLWVTNPIRNFSDRFWHEVFFAGLRMMDRAFLLCC
jgi:predicted HAD superfamily phosphohydrolase YqeG